MQIGALCLTACITVGAEPGMLRQTSSELSSLAEKAMPAVVSIKVEKTVKLGSGRQPYLFNNPFEFFGDDFMRRFFPGQQPGRTPQRQFKQRGAGSGFLISDDGYILSNNHVVGDADKITVKLHDGREFEAERIGTDPKSEVAVIKIDGTGFPTLPLADSAKIKVGEWVVAIGNPFGLAETLTVGIISAKGRSNIGIADYEDFIQTDAAINPGNSGGPLLNVQGEAIGINTAIYSRSGGYMGIGFAIPINMARYVKDQLIEKGEVVRSYLGIHIQPVTRELADSFDLDEARGILISQVVEDTGADQGGLQSGDIILQLNGKDVTSVGAFRNKVSRNAPGTTLELTVFRDGETMTMDVTTGTFPDVAGTTTGVPDDLVDKLGMTVKNLTPDLAQRFGYEGQEGVIVSQVQYGGSAALAGIQPGTLITSVNRTPVSNVSEFRRALAESTGTGRVLLHVSDNRGSRFVVLRIEQ